MGSSLNTMYPVEHRLRDAGRGCVDAYYDLGMVYSSGSDGVRIDLIEAHKWFNLAAIGGVARAQECRAQIADEMSAGDIIAAQKAARTWLRSTARATA